MAVFVTHLTQYECTTRTQDRAMLHPGCRLERLQGVKCTPERERIQFRFERKVIERGAIQYQRADDRNFSIHQLP